jgi:uncharacterized RDD family membrane protein YckC
MTKRPGLIIPAIILGVVFIGIAIMYWTVPPKSLPGPSIFGHEAGVSAVHVKHGVASFLLGLAFFAFAWFQTEPKKRSAAQD